MYLEPNSGRLRALVERTANSLAVLPVAERGAALQLLEDIVYARAVQHRGVGFAVNFSALFLDAVRVRLDATPAGRANVVEHDFAAAFDYLPPPASGVPVASHMLD
jgi:hypothetical protein